MFVCVRTPACPARGTYELQQNHQLAATRAAPSGAWSLEHTYSRPRLPARAHPNASGAGLEPATSVDGAASEAFPPDRFCELRHAPFRLVSSRLVSSLPVLFTLLACENALVGIRHSVYPSSLVAFDVLVHYPCTGTS